MLRNSTQVTPLMLARGLTAPSNCVCQSRNLTNNRNVLPGIRAAGKASPTSLQHSTISLLGKKKVSYTVSKESSCCLLLPSSHTGKGRGEYGNSARLGKEPGNQVGGIKVLPLGVKAIFAPSEGFQPSWEGKQKWVTECRENTELLSHQNISQGRRSRRCLEILVLLQSY